MTNDDEVEFDSKFLGVVEVDSGTLLIADPAYVLPRAQDKQPGIDYSKILEATTPAGPIGGQPVLLVQSFGGDGTYPVFGTFDGPDLLKITVYFVQPDEGE
jgi:hypothetical protein